MPNRIVYQTSTEHARQRDTRLRAMRAIAAASTTDEPLDEHGNLVGNKYRRL